MNTKLTKLAFFLILFWTTIQSYSQTTYYGGEDGKKFDYFLYYLDNYYVDTTDNKRLTDEAIKKVVSLLDPFSVYQTKEELEAQLNNDRGYSGKGFGLNYYLYQRERPIINKVNEGSAAFAQGIRKGDEIVAVNGVPIGEIPTTEIYSAINNVADTINITIRKYFGETNDFQLFKSYLPYKSVVSHYMVEESVGYIKIQNFSSRTNDEFSAAAIELQEQGMQHLLLDLRGNRGGVKDQAVNLADKFLTAGNEIVYSQGAHYEKEIEVATANGQLENINLYIFCDGVTASASEIFLGAIQDWGRGRILGEETFGKGLIQQSYKLDDGSAVRLTIAKYYTPSERILQKESHVNWTDQIDSENKKSEYTKQWLVDQRYKYTNKKGEIKLKGQGGIIPDVFIKKQENTTLNNWFFYKNNYLYDFAFDYYHIQKSILSKRYSRVVEFKNDEAIDEQLVMAFQEYLIKNKLTQRKDKSFPKGALDLCKAWIASLIWDDNDYYEIMNDSDPVLLRALEEIK